MKKKYALKELLGFLIGLSLCNNIFYVFSRNNFYLNISNVIGIVAFIYLIFIEKEYIGKYLKKIDRTFFWYMLVSVLSIIPAIITLYPNISLLSSYFNGIPLLILLFIEYFDIIGFADKKENILNGIKWGFILNILFSLIQYIYFIRGDIFNLFYKYFPTPSFQVCGEFSRLFYDSSITTTLKVYFFRAQGLFIETSYFSTFIVGSMMIAITRIKNKLIKYILTILTFGLSMLSESGNFIILIALLFIYYFITSFKGKFVIKRKKMITIPIFMIIFLLAFVFIVSNDFLMKKVENTFLSTNISDSSNSSRLRTLKEGMELIYKYPLGIGYNMTSKIFKMEYPSEIHSYIFSTILVNQLELGFIGNFIYLIFALKFIMKILKYSKEKEDIIIALSVLGIFLCQASNGINYWNIQFILGMYAIANITYNDLKDKVKKNENSNS